MFNRKTHHFYDFYGHFQWQIVSHSQRVLHHLANPPGDLAATEPIRKLKRLRPRRRRSSRRSRKTQAPACSSCHYPWRRPLRCRPWGRLPGKIRVPSGVCWLVSTCLYHLVPSLCWHRDFFPAVLEAKMCWVSDSNASEP